MTDVIDSLIDAQDTFSQMEQAITSGLSFRNKTLVQWEEFLSLPSISENMAPSDLISFNLKYIEINEIVMNNLAYAKSLYDISYANYKNNYRTVQESIIESYQNQNKKVAVEFINQYTSSKCADLFYVVKINEIFYNFWKIYHDKISLLDSRLSNLSFLMRS